MTALGKAEELLVSAQNKSQDSPSAPFINVAVEQLKRATSELNNAMKRVGQLALKRLKVKCIRLTMHDMSHTKLQRM